MITRTIVLLTLSFSLSACATVTRGTHEVVEINSEPVGAKAVSDVQSTNQKNTIDGYIGCEPTPCGLNLPRKSTPLITVSKEGHQPITFKLISTNATSKSATPEGSIIAGIPPGSYAQAGDPTFLKSIPIAGVIIWDSIMTLGASAILDAGTGAGRSLSPNPVTAFLAPEPSAITTQVPQGAKATTSIETSKSKTARAKNSAIPPVYKGCQPTPCSIPLPRRSEFIVTLEQDGYEDAQMYITNSTSSASFTANMAAAATTTATTTTTSAFVVAPALSALTFGLIPAQTFGTTLLSSAVPPLLVANGGMLLVDTATGANENLFPNPVVLQMAPQGTPTKTDPNVEPFLNILDIKDKRDYYCDGSQKFKPENQGKCQNLKAEYSQAVANKKAADKAAREKFKAAQKEAKRKDKTP